MRTSKALSQPCLWQSPHSRQGIAKNKNKSRPRFRNFPEVRAGRPDLCMVPHTPPPPFIPHMQRLRCRAKVKAKALKPHTPGCGAWTDFDVMLAVGVFGSWVRQRNRRSAVSLREDIQPQRTRGFYLYIFFWHYGHHLRGVSFHGCGVILAQSIVRTALPHPNSPGHLAFLFWKRSRLRPASQGLFFSIPPFPPHPPILYFPK